MHVFDWMILIVYLGGIVGMSVVLGRRQRTADDYYLAGRRMTSWPIALSIMATQVSAVSLIGAPAFVALRTGGGLRWLQYEFAVPLAMVVLILVFIPGLRSLPITTLYDYLQVRFGSRARRTLGLVFLASRGLSTAVALYAASVVLSVCLDLSLGWTMMILAAVTVVYTTIGGIEADIYSDIVQMFVLALGTIVALVIAMLRVLENTTWQSAWQQVDAGRLRILDFSSLGLGAGETYSFLPMVVGGFFLYISYYGCDQSQAQRLLTSRNERESSRGVFLNGLLRFPFTLVYCLFGLVLAVFLAEHPDFAARIPADHPDYLVPMFVLEFMPTGMVGLVMAAIFAAGMSSFDSAFNSMSAVTVRNILRRRRDIRFVGGDDGVGAGGEAAISVGNSRLWTLVWGVVCTLFGYFMSRSQVTVIELINMVGSAFYGPTLAMFTLGLLSRRAGEAGVLFGLAAGVGTNVLLWIFAPDVSWLWWNCTGFAVALCVGISLGRLPRDVSAPLPSTVQTATVRRWILTLTLAFGAMIALCVLLETLLH